MGPCRQELPESSFDPESLEVTGGPQVVLQDVSTIVASGAVQFALSEDGSLAYTPGGKVGIDALEFNGKIRDGEIGRAEGGR